MGAKRLGVERESGRNDSGANGKVGGMTGGETTRGERENGRNYSGANGKVGETTQIRVRKWYFTFLDKLYVCDTF